MEEILNKIKKVATFNPPATNEELLELENYLQIELDKEIKEMYLLHNGGEILGFEFLTIKNWLKK